MSEANNTTTTESGRSRANLPLLVLFLLSLAGNAYLMYNWYQDNYSDGKSLKELNTELKEALNSSNLSLDSLREQYNMLEQQYQNILLEYEGVKTERDEALADVEQKKLRIRQLINQGSPKALAEAKSRIETLKTELDQKDESLKVVKQEKMEAESRAESLQQYADELESSNQEKKLAVKDLEDKIKDVKFRIDELKVSPLRSRRGKLEVTDKASKVDQIEISFVVVKSELIKEGDKEIVLRILGTNGEVLGADNNTLQDSDKLITMKQVFKYDGTSKKLKFNYKHESDYKKGGYTAELWHNGERLLRTQFNLD